MARTKKTKPDKLMRLLVKSIHQGKELVSQWTFCNEVGWAANYAQYMAELNALVELLETYDCASVGGFGDGQDHDNPGDLFDRADWLLKKYK